MAIDFEINTEDWNEVRNPTEVAVDDTFSGVLRSNGEDAYVVNGKIVGYTGQDVTEIDIDNCHAQKAPSPVFPLLITMREIVSKNERGKYITSDTPFDEADSMVRDGGFIGYIELSEEVISGDYYGVYDGQGEMYVGLLDNGGVLFGDEAFEQAQKEVGIYRIVEADIGDVIPVRELVSSQSKPDEELETEIDSTPENDSSELEPPNTQHTEDSLTKNDTAKVSSQQDPFTEPEVETKSITSPPEVSEANFDDVQEEVETPDGDDIDIPNEVESVMGDGNNTKDRPQSGESNKEMREKFADVRNKIEELSQRVEQNEEKFKNFEQDITNLNKKIDQLTKELQMLSTSDESMNDNTGSHTDRADNSADVQELTREQALERIDVFARYKSKSDTTVSEAVEDTSLRDAASENIYFDSHTRFEKENVRINGELYDDFILGSVEMAFTKWILKELVYEIQDTGHTDSISDVYQNIPDINRAEFYGGIEVDDEYVEFDIIYWDSHGEPLFVCDTESGKEPVTGDQLEELMKKTQKVHREYSTIGGAFFVTSSFYEPKALQMASNDVKSGLLSSKEGYIKMNRKQGFHLCLFEERNGGFTMALPDL